ncbi:GGDEF domain-containing protein [candidate division CSSED10-310 bacterium]|uniref:GGDEF domain-containing protein n=1 Tax=candidate division CSSED10-310 bacterium TaxID=2855610 RepID=A0ABV6Z5H1_UNCC1
MTDNDMKILFVEDDKFVINVVKALLEDEGYTVYVAKDGIEALNILEEIVPHLILCDIMMPKLNGFEFRNFIMNDPDLKLVPFIFLTALSDTEDRIRGFKLDADDYITKPFEEEDLIARVQTKLKKFRQYQDLIAIDSLTGLLSRRYIMNQLKKETERVKRYNAKCSIVMVDIDTFKEINDNYGHDVGDMVLTLLGHAFQNNIRETDFAGRYGGEEFLIIMPGVDKQACLAATNRLKKTISDLPISDYKIHITFSGGISMAPEDGTDVKTLLIKADKALYQAKKLGKDRIIPYQEKLIDPASDNSDT